MRGRRRTIYLANPYGFSGQQRAGPLRQLVEALEALGLEVWEPFGRNGQQSVADSPDEARRILRADTAGVRDADALFAVVNGCPPDEGVMVEVGMAAAWGKPTFLFRDDFRTCCGSGGYPVNLMVFAGLPAGADWRRHWYADIAGLSAPGKALAEWAAGREPAS